MNGRKTGGLLASGIVGEPFLLSLVLTLRLFGFKFVDAMDVLDTLHGLESDADAVRGLLLNIELTPVRPVLEVLVLVVDVEEKEWEIGRLCMVLVPRETVDTRFSRMESELGSIT